MPRLKTTVVPSADPKTQAIFVFQVSPGFIGQGIVDWTCGNCDTILAQGVELNTFTNIIFQCPTCHAYSVPRETH